MVDEYLQVLNVYEIAEPTGGGTRHLLAFIEPVRAGSTGIDSRAIVGEVAPTDEGGYDPRSLDLNPQFIESIVGYLNEVQAVAPEVVRQARALPSAWLYVVDPRNVEESEEDPPPSDLVGAFAVDEAGQVVPRSFQYNAHHLLIDHDRGLSGLFSDKDFYRWLHPSG